MNKMKNSEHWVVELVADLLNIGPVAKDLTIHSRLEEACFYKHVHFMDARFAGS
jgi:hypothetical protein